ISCAIRRKARRIASASKIRTARLSFIRLVLLIPSRPRGIALKEGTRGSGGHFGQLHLAHSSFAPVGAMFHDPIEQRFLKADIGPGFFALDPFVFQNLLALSEKLF